jgi:hypothetical protein
MWLKRQSKSIKGLYLAHGICYIFKHPYAGGIYYIKTPRVYNSILTNPNFWRGLKYDRVLVFQHDSGLLKHGIEHFLEWDFIGRGLKIYLVV